MFASVGCDMLIGAKLADGTCDAWFNCSIGGYDGGDYQYTNKLVTLPACESDAEGYQLCQPYLQLDCLTDAQCQSVGGGDCLSLVTSLLGDGNCDHYLNCEDYNFDFGDCPDLPSCSCEDGTGDYQLCEPFMGMTCVTDAICQAQGATDCSTLITSLKANGECETYLNCTLYDYDNGDCEAEDVFTFPTCDEGGYKFCTPVMGIACATEMVCQMQSYPDCATAFGESLGNGVCQAAFNCSDWLYDFGDCAPKPQYPPCETGPGYQLCVPYMPYGWTCLTDAICQGGGYANCTDAFEHVNGNGACAEIYNCSMWNYDGGDCLGEPPSEETTTEEPVGEYDYTHPIPCDDPGVACDPERDPPGTPLSRCQWYSNNTCCTRDVTDGLGTYLRSYKALGTYDWCTAVRQDKDCDYMSEYIFCALICDNEHAPFGYDDNFGEEPRNGVTLCTDTCQEWYDQCAGVSVSSITIGNFFTTSEQFCMVFGHKVVDSDWCLPKITPDSMPDGWSGSCTYVPTPFEQDPDDVCADTSSGVGDICQLQNVNATSTQIEFADYAYPENIFTRT
eukprot:TRINITY_DN15634_c0_g1::TRINITY_DN15634_c0_g1_i1::g.18752::m.18752 TRINITY_DN15634_c0_g1::TRINITY_DN15634_c0_g1_i1::g.18752  ORF type:complete len:586 (-),score=83.69,Folate_rec/PF03024.9/6.4e+03,Folate_rec/PF03024.9/1.5e+04,Folate_rec/PF03024.9/6e-11 TRINITY_DN15634_c0_g1_i1:440-2122(-)